MEGVALEAGGEVGAQGAVVLVEDFEGEFAAAEFAGAGLDGGEQAAADAAAAVGGHHADVVQVDEWLGGEGREAEETHGHADRRVAIKGEEDERGGMCPQAGDEAGARCRGERGAVAHRVARIGVHHREHRGLVIGPVEVGLQVAEGGVFGDGGHGRVGVRRRCRPAFAASRAR